MAPHTSALCGVHSDQDRQLPRMGSGGAHASTSDSTRAVATQTKQRHRARDLVVHLRRGDVGVALDCLPHLGSARGFL